MDPIHVISGACLKGFLLEITLQNEEHSRLMPVEKLTEELNRFKIWCGNLGALQSGRSSLDFRLRESIVMRTNVLKLLDRLQQTLEKSESLSLAHTLLPIGHEGFSFLSVLK
jgi:hypothetical protein